MPALAETQTPFLERDARNGLIPKRLPDDPDDLYLHRLATLYCTDVETVRRVLARYQR